jgi:hypothetical protein
MGPFLADPNMGGGGGEVSILGQCCGSGWIQKTFGRIRSVIEINVSDPKIESGSESGSETFIFGSGSDPAKSFGSFRIRIRNTAFVLISKITVGQPR